MALFNQLDKTETTTMWQDHMKTLNSVIVNAKSLIESAPFLIIEIIEIMKITESLN